MALLPGSPAIDAGNPSGCTDGHGHLPTTDQRGMPRPDKEDSAGCDIGAFESQTDQREARPGRRHLKSWELRAKLCSYFSLATTNSGAHSRARLISESGNVQIAARAASAKCAASADANSSEA